MKDLNDYKPEEFGINKDEINSLIMEQASDCATEKMVKANGLLFESFVEPDIEEGEVADENTPTRYKEKFQEQYNQFYDEEYDRIAKEIGFDFCAEDGIYKTNMRQFVKGQAVYWNDPNGQSSGRYKVLDPYTERNNDHTEVDVAEFDDRMILIGNGSSEAEVYAQELEIPKTKVIFRKFKQGGDIIALFPEQGNRANQMVGSYMHIGQHSDADYIGVIAATTPAKESEYAELLAELKQIGYDDLIVVKRCKSKSFQ